MLKPAKNTSHIVSLTKRMQNIREQVGSYLTNFVKWERAFDKVPHQQYFVALERWGVHQPLIEVLDQSYIKVQSGRVPACPEAAPLGAGKQKVSGH